MKRWIAALGLVVIGVSIAMTVFTRPSTARSTKIRRTILLSLKPEATPADIQKMSKDVKETIGKLKGVHNLYVGPQTNNSVPFQFGISMDFDDENALKAYRTDAEHRRTHNDYVHLIAQSQITDIRDE